MKKTVMIAIVVILLLLVGIFLLSPFSPFNKVSVDGEGIEIPEGYKVTNTSKTSITISNDTNTLKVFSTETTNDLKNATKEYQAKFNGVFNVTIKELKTNNSEEVYKTVVKPENTTVTIYWFNHNDKTYKIRSENAVKGTDDIALKIINSMN